MALPAVDRSVGAGHRSTPRGSIGRRAARTIALSIALSLLPAAVVAQSLEVWASRNERDTPSAAIHVFDVTTGTEIDRLDSPAGACVGRGAMTPDRRSFLVPIQQGLARIDVRTRQLAEVIARPGGCLGWIRIAPSGRWWHVRSETHYEIIDAATRVISHLETAPNVVAVDFDATRRYELRATGTSFTVQAWPQDTVSGAPVWTRTASGTPIALVVGGGSVYVAAHGPAVPGDGDLYRLDAATGEERAHVVVGSPNAALDYFDDRIYISRYLLVVDAYRADTLELLGSTTVRGWIYELFFDRVNRTGYVASFAPGIPPRPRETAYLVAFDPATMRAMEPVVPGRTSYRSLPSGFALGDVEVPRPPRVTALDVTAGRVRLRWEPDASGPSQWSFEIRGARRGAPLVGIATVGASSRSWESPAVPAGSYVLQVIARNRIGASAPSRSIDIGIDEQEVPQAPSLPAVESSGDVIRMMWTAAAAGPAPAGYQIEAAPAGTSQYAAVATTTLPEFWATNLPTGTWNIRMRAFTAGGVGPPSSAVAITTGRCQAAPAPPGPLAALSTGGLVTVQWPVPTPILPAGYILRARALSGQSVVFQLDVPGRQTSIEAIAPPGPYLVSATARNACGTSTSSNEVLITVP